MYGTQILCISQKIQYTFRVLSLDTALVPVASTHLVKKKRRSYFIDLFSNNYVDFVEYGIDWEKIHKSGVRKS